jgi:hypothetical protein
VRPEHAAPGGDLERGKLFDGGSLHMQLFSCHRKFS